MRRSHWSRWPECAVAKPRPYRSCSQSGARKPPFHRLRVTPTRLGGVDQFSKRWDAEHVDAFGSVAAFCFEIDLLVRLVVFELSFGLILRRGGDFTGKVCGFCVFACFFGVMLLSRCRLLISKGAFIDLLYFE